MQSAPQTGQIKPSDIIDIALRRRWFIVIPTFFAVIAGIYLAFTLPKIYEAKTLILVQPQKVPEDYVRSVVSSDMEDRMATITQQITSRTNLERAIKQLDLFNDPASRHLLIEDKVAMLENGISVDTFRSRQSAFSVAYQDENPEIAMRVANTLAENFIDDNIRRRENQAKGTSQFLEDELEMMRNRLQQYEQNLSNYRQRYMGQLPEQLPSNLQILSRLQEQLNNKQIMLRDIKLRLTQLENQDAIVQVSDNPSVQEPAEDATNLSQLKRRLANLKMRYTDSHPDVIRLKNKIQELEAQAGQGTRETAVVVTDPLARQKMELMKEKLKTENDIVQLNQEIAVYEQRVENTPKREQELIAIKRDYDNIKESYDSLLARKMEADLSVNLEKKKKGEQFHILDTAKTPSRPIKPDMRKIFMMAVAAGLGFGCGIAYLLEFMDASFRKPEEVEGHLQLSVLGTVPTLLTRKKRIRQKVGSALCLAMVALTLALMGVFAYISLRGTDQIMTLVKPILSI